MHKEKTIISVIMPVFNSEKYLHRSINSILKQSFRHFELLIINDGSSDCSEDICMEYANSDPRIKYFYKTNEGASIARNVGIKHALGEWIAFVDSDDELKSNYLMNLYQNSMDTDIVFEGMTISNNSIQKKVGINQNVYFDGAKALTDFYSKFNVFYICGPWCKLFKKKIISNNGIHFSPEITCAEDYGFLIDYLAYCKTLKTIDYHDYIYYSNANSLSSRLHSFEKEYSSLVALCKKYNEFARIYPFKSIKKQKDSFLGYYTYRVIYSVYKENNPDGCSRIKKLKKIPRQLIKTWYFNNKTQSYFIKFSAFLLIFKLYRSFDILTTIAYKRNA